MKIVNQKRYKNYKILSTILKTVDSFVIIAITSSSVTLSLTGFGLLVIPISSGFACGLTFTIQVLYELIMNEHNDFDKDYERAQQTVDSCDKLYEKCLQDNVIDSLCIIFSKYVNEIKIDSFLEIKL